MSVYDKIDCVPHSPLAHFRATKVLEVIQEQIISLKLHNKEPEFIIMSECIFYDVAREVCVQKATSDERVRRAIYDIDVALTNKPDTIKVV